MDLASKVPTRVKRIAKSKWSWLACLILIILTAYFLFKIKVAIDSIEYALTPPKLPEYNDIATENTVRVNPMGWPSKKSDWFHHASQGTATIPIPYQWLTALEAPKKDPRFIIFSQEALFKDDYILKLGFIKQAKTKLNSDALPIGFAKTPSIYFPGINRKATAAGFTCAACHTGQITYADKRYIIDGAPAMTDLSLFTKALGAALGQTVVSSKIPLLDGRFDRFARRVLGSNYNILTRNKLKVELSATLKKLSKDSDSIEVTEGFTRLDALNRIGNQVFDEDMQRRANYAPIDAPVNYPHIWTTSWFNWVQYDGSIMQPLSRNTGEALGVKAYVDTSSSSDQRFASSVAVKSLRKIEEWLSGTHPLNNGNKFNGLKAPSWPADFPAIDPVLAHEGEALYDKHCQGCHLPETKSEEFWSAKYWRKIRYVQNSQLKETKDPYLNLNIIPLRKIGTDSAQAQILKDRTVDVSGLGLDTEVCTIAKSLDSLDVGGGDDSQITPSISASQNALRFVPLNDSSTANFALALGAFVERTNQQWFRQNYVPKVDQADFEGQRPNCLQAGQGYKARPLNGVWATAPFLHNGSVASLYDLLSPLQERPQFVQLGSQAFDAKHVGIKQDPKIAKKIARGKEATHELTDDYVDGLFILDTRQAGNSNRGHVFDDSPKEAKTPGKIGPKFSEQEKMALIEYLKTL